MYYLFYFQLFVFIRRESLGREEKLWIGEQLVESFIKLHALRAFHGDFGSGKVFLTSQNKVIIGDFAPIKPFGLQSRQQSPIEFYQIWFDEGLDGESVEIGKGCYLAPERLKFNSEVCFESADLFSLGCVLMELFGSSRGFLQFKDTLKLSTATEEEYENLLDNFIDKCKVSYPQIVALIKRLCARDPKKRSLKQADLEMIKSLSDPKIRNWRNSIENYKKSALFFEQKQRIFELPSEIFDYENLLLMILKDKNQILVGLLLKHLLENQKSGFVFDFDVILRALNGNCFAESVLYEHLLSNNTSKCEHFPLIEAFNSGNRDVLFQQISKETDLKEVLFILEARKVPVEKLKGILNKLLQIYRARDIKDIDFEVLLLFEYLKIGAEQEEIENLYKTFKISDRTVPASLSRMAFQLDLEKNKVPLVQSDNKSHNTNGNRSNNQTSKFRPRLKQRLLTKLKIFDEIIGILQSPDKILLICYSETTLFFWDLKGLLRGNRMANDPIASVNPRSEAVIVTLLYGDDPDTIIISFKDGIIGLYK